MLTSTCPNSGCGKSVSRKEMLSYIENSGGRDYPFFTDGRVLRIATLDGIQPMALKDLNEVMGKVLAGGDRHALEAVEDSSLLVTIVLAQPATASGATAAR